MFYSFKVKIITILCGLVFFPAMANALSQINPAPNSTISQNVVMFRFYEVSSANKYRFIVFQQLTAANPLNRIIHHDTIVDFPFFMSNGKLNFGNSYQWQVNFLDSKGKAVDSSQAFNFSIIALTPEFKDKYTMSITHDVANKRMKNGYVILDNPGMIVDFSGKPVWVMPSDSMYNVLNLKLLPSGNFSFLRSVIGTRDDAGYYEMTATGTIKYNAPRGMMLGDCPINAYHHDYQRLKNGNLMLAGTCWDSSANPPQPYSTLIELNGNGEMVWHWSARDITLDPKNTGSGRDMGRAINGFYFDEASDQIYMSIKSLNKAVFRVKKSTGELNHTFGGTEKNGKSHSASGIFHYVHAPMVADGNLFVFNNGRMMGSDTVSGIIGVPLPETPKKNETVLNCPLFFGKQQHSYALRLGDIDILPNGNYLVSMGSIPRVLEVDNECNIVWGLYSGFPAGEDSANFGAIGQHQYRVEYIPGLYPCEFSVKRKGGVDLTRDKEGKVNLTVTIFNIGHEETEYSYSLVSSARNVLAEGGGYKIESGKTREISISVKIPNDFKGDLGLRIMPVCNPDKAQSMIYTLK